MIPEHISFQNLFFTALFCYAALLLQNLGYTHPFFCEGGIGDKAWTYLRAFLQSC